MLGLVCVMLGTGTLLVSVLFISCFNKIKPEQKISRNPPSIRMCRETLRPENIMAIDTIGEILAIEERYLAIRGAIAGFMEKLDCDGTWYINQDVPDDVIDFYWEFAHGILSRDGENVVDARIICSIYPPGSSRVGSSEKWLVSLSIYEYERDCAEDSVIPTDAVVAFGQQQFNWLLADAIAPQLLGVPTELDLHVSADK
jgi:hypothetical protein